MTATTSPGTPGRSVGDSSAIRREVGGFPFVDPGFQPARLLTAVACCRWARANPAADTSASHDDLMAVLQPDRARQVRGLDLHLDLPYGQLTDDQHQQVSHARDAILGWLPQWADLIRLPLVFLGLEHSAAISSSNFAWPQHIFLAPAAFANSETLAEQVTHETSHQWLYLLEELWPLQVDNPSARFTLPSGTSGRSPSELLGASHVVANLYRLWSTMPVGLDARQRRLEHLRRYAAGCVALLVEAREFLTDDGQALAYRLTEELNAL